MQLHALNRKSMLYLDIPRLVSERGITSPGKFLQRYGISREVWRYLKDTNKPTISLDLMEKLCLAFNCTPSDLFSWSGAVTHAAGLEKHPLQELRHDTSASLLDKVSMLPAGKLNKLRRMVDELAKEE